MGNGAKGGQSEPIPPSVLITPETTSAIAKIIEGYMDAREENADYTGPDLEECLINRMFAAALADRIVDFLLHEDRKERLDTRKIRLPPGQPVWVDLSRISPDRVAELIYEAVDRYDTGFVGELGREPGQRTTIDGRYNLRGVARNIISGLSRFAEEHPQPDERPPKRSGSHP